MVPPDAFTFTLFYFFLVNYLSNVIVVGFTTSLGIMLFLLLPFNAFKENGTFGSFLFKRNIF